jgi:hypothetical protein
VTTEEPTVEPPPAPEPARAPKPPETVRWRAEAPDPESTNGTNGTTVDARNGTASNGTASNGTASNGTHRTASPPKKRRWRLFSRAH